ncbi:MAG: 5-keto-L-gluconate epimerase [bacterium]
MKLSIVLSTQPASFSALAYKGEFEANVAKIAALGYDGVELAVRNPGLLNAKYVEKVVVENGLRVPAIGTGQAYGEEGLSFTHQDEEIRKQAVQRIREHIDFAAQFQALVILGLIRGKIEDTIDKNLALEWLLQALRECSTYAISKSVKLVMEPINRYETNLVNTVAEGLDLIEKVGAENLGLLLDTFHMNIEEPSIEESIRNAAQRLFHFHIADSNRWYPGAGHINFEHVVAVLHDIGYKGYISAEILPLPNSDTCAEKTIITMRRINIRS